MESHLPKAHMAVVLKGVLVVLIFFYSFIFLGSPIQYQRVITSGKNLSAVYI